MCLTGRRKDTYLCPGLVQTFTRRENSCKGKLGAAKAKRDKYVTVVAVMISPFRRVRAFQASGTAGQFLRFVACVRFKRQALRAMTVTCHYDGSCNLSS